MEPAKTDPTKGVILNRILVTLIVAWLTVTALAIPAALIKYLFF